MSHVTVAPQDGRLEAAVVASGGDLSGIDQASGVVVSEMATDVLAEVVRQAPLLRWVQLRSAGIEALVGSPLAAAVAARGVTVTNAAGIYGPNVAEHALGLILGMGRNLFQAARTHRWGPLSAGRSLHGRHVCVIGAGGIASSLLDVLSPFGCHTTVVRRRATPLPGADQTVGLDGLYEALSHADIVVIACPLTPETSGLLDEEAFSHMQRHPLIVNVGRGAVVDTEALRQNLLNGGVCGAALDVTDPEPLPPEDSLWGFGNVVITPHTANDKALGEDAYIALVGQNVRRFTDGDSLLNVVSTQDLIGPSGAMTT